MSASLPIYPAETFDRIARARRAQAATLAGNSLRRLKSRGIAAWVVGSLASGRFTAQSDVDFAVDCSVDEEGVAFALLEEEMGSFGFDLFPLRRMTEDAARHLMETARDADDLARGDAAA